MHVRFTILSFGLLLTSTLVALAKPVTPDEARAVAKEAYLYGFPLVDSYRIQHSYFLDRGGPEFKAPWNTLFNNARVYTPEDKAIQTPNSDTTYSYVGADLRTEPLIYPAYFLDSDEQKLDGAHRYTLRFAKDRSPPANAFWSLTISELPSSLLYANPLDRYLINSPMLPNLKRDADGGLSLYVQHDSPGKDKESNWLPSPPGPFFAALRLYWPKPEALNGQWQAPAMQRTN